MMPISKRKSDAAVLVVSTADALILPRLATSSAVFWYSGFDY